MEQSQEEVWFVYDGQCPLCLMGAPKFRIEQAAGTLHLLDKRTAKDTHPLIMQINARGLDLDTGMVIKFGDALYQGADALHLMALIGSGSGWFNRMNALLFRSKKTAYFCYPAMRAARNLLLRIKGVPQIKNLEHAGK